MREIEFKGINKQNNQWVYGGYHKHQVITECPIISTGESFKPTEYAHLIISSGFSDWNLPKPIWAYEVYDYSVCQYTEKNDKLNKKIFEGDIVFENLYKSYGVIFFENSSFYIRYDRYDKDGNEKVFNLGYYSSDMLEVVGNIYQDLSLLSKEYILRNIHYLPKGVESWEIL